MTKVLSVFVAIASATMLSSCTSVSAPLRVVKIVAGTGVQTVPEGKMWKVSRLTPCHSETDIGTGDLEIKGQVWIGDHKAYNVSGSLCILVNTSQVSPIWILGGSLVAVGDSRGMIEVEEYQEHR